MIRRTLVMAVLCATMAFTLGCGFLSNLIGGGGGGGTVSNLWSDVPAFPGTTKADLEMPLVAKIAIQAMFQGKLDFIAFTTNQGADSVVNFYTAERMQGSGWTSESGGCQGSTGNEGAQGAICFFTKKEGQTNHGLAIFVAQDEKTNLTNLFFARINMANTPTP